MKAKLIKIDGEYLLNPSIVGTSLSLKNCQAIERGYDLDELVSEYCTDDINDDIYFSFKAGFQKALELMGDAVFNWLEKKDYLSDDKDILKEEYNYQTEWDVTVEMEYVGECKGNNDEGCFQDSPGHNCGCFERRPKLDADGCLILKRV